MKELIVSYQKEWDNEGATYSQTVKIPKTLLDTLNEKLTQVLVSKSHPVLWDTINYIYIEPLKQGKNFTKLTTARIVKHELTALGVDVKRYLDDRNTTIVIY